MCKLKFLLTSTGIKLGVFFFGRFFRVVTQCREAKKWPRRRSHASLTSDLEHIDVFLLDFPSMCMYIVGCRLIKNKPLTESLKFAPFCFFQLLEHKQSQRKTATTMAPSKRLHMHARFQFFAHLFAFVCKKIQDCDNLGRVVRSWVKITRG